MMRAWVLGALALLAGCGDVQGLTPRPGHALPIKAATNSSRPDADHLLAETAQERPGRSDELLIKSQVRQSDRFDLPPQ